jgi:hypothetical protein
MTLIIAAANSEHAVLVADRRLSYDGRLVDDDQSKLGVTVTDDPWLAFGHTGLARAGTLDVHPWLLEALIECAKPDHLASGIVNRFRERASERLRRVRVPKPADKRLSVLFAGYRYSEEPARVSLALVSNFERENEVHSEPFDDFEATFMQDRRPSIPSHTEPAIILIGGRQDLVPITELQKLLGLLELRRPFGGLGREDVGDHPRCSGSRCGQLGWEGLPERNVDSRSAAVRTGA